jgi:hypothetical protein
MACKFFLHLATLVYRLAKAYPKAEFNKKYIVEDQLKFHTVDYVKNKIPPMKGLKPRTIINSYRHQPPEK